MRSTLSVLALVVPFVAWAALVARPAAAQADPPAGGGGAEAAPEAPPPLPEAVDKDEYAAKLVSAARDFAAAGAWGKVFSYLRYVRTELGDCRYAKEHAKAIEAEYRKAEDALATAAFEKAKSLADKNPDKAKEKLDQIRKDYAGAKLLGEKKAEFEAFETRIRTALWDGKASFRGEAVLPAEGVLRLTYRFDKVEELADFEGTKGPAKVEAGRMSADRAAGVLKHRLPTAAGADITVQVEARGFGKLALGFDGDAALFPSKGLALEIDSAPKALRLKLARDGRVIAEGEDARTGFQATTPWAVRVERKGGELRAHLVFQGEARAAVKVPSPAPAPDGSLPDGLRLLFVGGTVEVDGLVVEGPLPPAGAVGAAPDAAKAPLPKKVWIPLQTTALDAWKVKGRWKVEPGDVLVQGDAPSSLISIDLEGRSIEKFQLALEFRVAPQDKRARKEPYFAICFPAGEERLAWVFTDREMRLDGAQGIRYLERLAPTLWHTLLVRVDEKQVECYVGSTTVLRAARKDLSSGGNKRADKVDGVGFICYPGPDRVEIRKPRIRVE